MHRFITITYNMLYHHTFIATVPTLALELSIGGQTLL
jgi:hypothetical protein